MTASEFKLSYKKIIKFDLRMSLMLPLELACLAIDIVWQGDCPHDLTNQREEAMI